MVAPAIPLIYWGIGILLAGGAAVTARRIQDEDLGRLELPASIQELMDRQPQPEPEPERAPPRPLPPPFDAEVERRARERCEDDPEGDCQMCKALSEGSSTYPQHMFQGGTVERPSPRARGALYQHHVIGWKRFVARESGGALTVEIEEWNWKLGVAQSWDGLVFSECKLLECKLGYRDFLDPSDPDYTRPNPRKPFLGTLQRAFGKQLQAQYGAMIGDWPDVSLEWVFSDQEVMWQFVAMTTDLGLFEVGNRHAPFHLAPSGTEFVNELYADGTEDTYGYWEDV